MKKFREKQKALAAGEKERVAGMEQRLQDLQAQIGKLPLRCLYRASCRLSSGSLAGLLQEQNSALLQQGAMLPLSSGLSPCSAGSQAGSPDKVCCT